MHCSNSVALVLFLVPLLGYFCEARNQTFKGTSRGNTSYIAALEQHLFYSSDTQYYYDSSVRPNPYGELQIDVMFWLSSVSKVDEKNGLLNPQGVLKMSWNDERLTWDPEQFGNVTKLEFNGYHNRVWIPKFFHNGFDYVAPPYQAVASCIVDQNGNVDVVMYVNENIPCNFDLTEFPRDTQNCAVVFFQSDTMIKFKVLRSGVMKLTGGNDDVTVHNNKHKAWDVLNVTLEKRTEVTSSGNPEFLTTIITIKRHSAFFLRIYVAPVCFILLLIPIIFLLPPDSSEKLTYGAILLFSMITVSQTVESIYPPYTDKMPYLIQLTTASGALLFLCILLTSIMSSAERIGRKRPLPLFIKRYIVGVIGPFLLVKENEDSLTHGSVHIKSVTPESNQGYVVHTEQTIDLSGDAHTNGNTKVGAPQATSHETTQALHALVNELKQSRLQSRAFDDWTNFFTILNRFLFLFSLLVGIIIMLCFA